MIQATHIKKHPSRNLYHAKNQPAHSHRKPTDQSPYKSSHYIMNYRAIANHTLESVILDYEIHVETDEDSLIIYSLHKTV